VSDERDSAGSAGDGTNTPRAGESRGQTAVVSRPLRPTGKRSRRGAVTGGEGGETDTAAPDSRAGVAKNGTGTVTKTAKRAERPGEGRRNPIAFVLTYLNQVIAELRKVIWPNRKQMVSYTTVVLVFLVFMVALIGLVDFGLAKLVLLVFG
jgi:preprotein translocase subunit SecE